MMALVLGSTAIRLNFLLRFVLGRCTATAMAADEEAVAIGSGTTVEPPVNEFCDAHRIYGKIYYFEMCTPRGPRGKHISKYIFGMLLL